MSWTTTTPPFVLLKEDASTDVLGLPLWAFAALVGICSIMCCMTPLFWWLKRQTNLQKPYVPRDPPDLDGFVVEVVERAQQSGVLQQSRLGRS
mmetsp:Transcript_22685/g.51872  ORF Transcript_22685/g.51872 Transcript_22685/m.51872 type:complete len:93 (-) Transcript_22685:141-419(-)